MNITVEASMECYVYDGKQHFISLPQFLIQRRLQPSGLDYDLELGIDSGEVVWANRTDIFD